MRAHIQSKFARSLALKMLDGEFNQADQVIILDVDSIGDPSEEYDWLPRAVKFLMPGSLKISIDSAGEDDFVLLKLEWIDSDTGEVLIDIGITKLSIGSHAIWVSEDLYWPMKLI